MTAYRQCPTEGCYRMLPCKRHANPPVRQPKLTPEQMGMQSLFDQAPPPVRPSDPLTSFLGSKSIKYRATSQKAKLLITYLDVEGLTDDEAAEACGLFQRPGCCWWHRCSDLRAEGMIAPTGSTKQSPHTGEERMICVVTDHGRRTGEWLRAGA